MAYLHHRPERTAEGPVVVLQKAAAKVRGIGTPQCIAVVDRGGHLLACLRMDGAKVLSQCSATQGRFTNLRGGLPNLVEGRLFMAISGASGNAEQDPIVARAGSDALLATLVGREPG